jgi:SpoVK/Ycf46/Vps4 family AAA+-type ATPase
LVAASRLAARDGTALDADRLRQSRAKALSEQAGDILRVHDTPVRPDEVAGIEQLMRFVHVRAQAGEPLRGIILDGPPGVGKTFVVRAISQAFGYLLVEFRQVYSMYVGETDRRLDRALSLIESLAPCAVWFDEIDQWLPRRGGSSSQDGGTSERLLARLWQFLGATHARQDVMFIGTTNRPDLLDAATLDRAGVVAPLIHPTRHDLPSLGHAIARQQGRTLSPYVDFAALADHHAMAFATARDLHTIIAEAAVLAGGSPIEQHHLASAINDVTAPLDTTAQELMALLAVRSCRHRSLLPWIDANGNPSLPRPPYIDAIIDERGEVDPFRLQERIHRLSGALAWT